MSCDITRELAMGLEPLTCCSQTMADRYAIGTRPPDVRAGQDSDAITGPSAGSRYLAGSVWGKGWATRAETCLIKLNVCRIA